MWLGLAAELGRGNINNKQPVKTFYLEIEKLLSGSGLEGWRQGGPARHRAPQWRGGDLGPFLYLHAALQPPLAALIQLQSWVHFYVCMTHRDTNNQPHSRLNRMN